MSMPSKTPGLSPWSKPGLNPALSRNIIGRLLRVSRSIRKLLSTSNGQGSPFQTVLSLVFDLTISDLTRSFSSGLIDPEREGESQPKNLILSRILCDLHREDVPIFIDKFKALLEELSVDVDKTDSVSYACTVAFYPRTSDAREAKA